ncbi:MAG: hypothetical protein E1N59_414 [Puniceicoccaceae bacterium 5H]|nr:MAG: hypothetical protein E1N59_414 [Puniceicoccaceae bacterium 5H]
MTAKFRLGHILATHNANDTIHPEDRLQALMRHVSGDWGNVCPEDAALNDAALTPGEEGRILSVYTDRADVTFWIITEWDRSVTTILLPEDY